MEAMEYTAGCHQHLLVKKGVIDKVLWKIQSLSQPIRA